MALKKLLELNGSLIFKNNEIEFKQEDIKISTESYIKVSSVSGNKDLCSIEVEFDITKAKIYKNYCFTPLLDGENFIKQSYQYLKTLDEFKDAEDC